MVLERTDEIICVTDQVRFALQTWPHILLEPFVQDVVQVHVGKEW